MSPLRRGGSAWMRWRTGQRSRRRRATLPGSSRVDGNRATKSACSRANGTYIYVWNNINICVGFDSRCTHTVWHVCAILDGSKTGLWHVWIHLHFLHTGRFKFLLSLQSTSRFWFGSMIIPNAAHLLECLPALKLYAAFNTSNKKKKNRH